MVIFYKRKIITIVLVVFFIISCFSNIALAEFQSEAGSAILMEESTGQILYEKNSDNAVPPASITKLMTLLIGFDAVKAGKATWDDMVPVSEKAWKIEGSEMFLEVNKSVNYKELVTGISVVSANDGCVALAEYLYGSEEAFVGEMNKRAKEIGLTKTHFLDSTGLPAEGHVMSARDIALLAKYLMNKHPEILDIEKTTEFTYNNIKQQNRNPLLGKFPGADGLKTGWTDEAGYCLVGTAKQNGVRLISVVLNTKDVKQRLIASQELLNYGFKNFEFFDLKKAGEVVDEIQIKDGKVEKVEVKLDNNIKVYIPISRKNDVKFVTIKDVTTLKAPSSIDTKVGKLETRLDNKVIGSATISTVKAAEKIGIFQRFFRWIASLFGSKS